MWTESMELQSIGRIDNQVKLRGFRIKLEKVDRTTLLANAAIRQAAAVVGDHCLRSAAPRDIDVRERNENLSSILPLYAQSSQIIAVPFITVSPNQKLDRNAIEDYITPTQDKER